MHIMFVCTGNVCRSPMGELLMRRYLSGTSITVSSAGTHALVGHPIDPSSGRLMDSVGIDSGEFRSRQLTRELAENADLILCFEEEQRNNIVDMAPAVVRRTFLVTDFANMCLYCAQHDLVKGLTVQERLNSVIEASSFIRPMIPAPRDVEDPFTKDFPVFRKAANQTNKAIWIILNSMRKHYRVNGAPARTMIEHAKETQPVAAEPASAEPVEISLPVFAPYQSNAAETEVMKAGTCGTGKDGSSANGTGAGPARDAVRGTGRIAAVASIGYVGATRNSPAITGSSLSAYAA